MKKIITLTTDFGTQDGYLGAVKGVLKKINPELEIIDITHQIDPFDVWQAAFTLRNFYQFFPAGTIHLVVVDPGVGSNRQAFLIESEDYFFIGPDNGVFSFIYEKERIKNIISLTNPKYFLSQEFTTFHARDVFAPVAGYLSLGMKVDEFGSLAKECFKFIIPQPRVDRNKIQGAIIRVDKFGNLITNIDSELVKKIKKKKDFEITIGRRKIKNVVSSYAFVKEKQICVLLGSSGFLEVSANKANAQKILRAKRNASIVINFKG